MYYLLERLPGDAHVYVAQPASLHEGIVRAQLLSKKHKGTFYSVFHFETKRYWTYYKGKRWTELRWEAFGEHGKVLAY